MVAFLGGFFLVLVGVIVWYITSAIQNGHRREQNLSSEQSKREVDGILMRLFGESNLPPGLLFDEQNDHGRKRRTSNITRGEDICWCIEYSEFKRLLEMIFDESRGVRRTDGGEEMDQDEDAALGITKLTKNDVRGIASFYLTTFCNFDAYAERTVKGKESDYTLADVKKIARNGRAAFERHEILPGEPLKDFLLPFVYDQDRFMTRAEKIIVDGRTSREVMTQGNKKEGKKEEKKEEKRMAFSV